MQPNTIDPTSTELDDGPKATCTPDDVTLLGEENRKFLRTDFDAVENRLETPAPAGSGRTVCRLLTGVMPAGGMIATCFSLASTSIGAGIVGLPAAFSSTGMAMAIAYLLLIAMETVYSLRILAIVSTKTGLRSYEQMISGLLHPKGKYFVALLRFIFCLGCCVAYIVTIGDLLTPILTEATDAPEYLRSRSGIRLLQACLWLLFFLPLSIPREINSLRYVSAAGLIFILFFCVCVIVHACGHGMKEDPRPVTKAVNTGNIALNGLGVFMFSFTCQVNAVEVYYEMTNRSFKRFTICSIASMTVCGVLYFMTGLFGYLDFGEAVEGSVLLMFRPLDEPQFLVSSIGVFVKICASYGLLGSGARFAAYEVIGWDLMTVAFWKHLIFAVVLSTVSLLLGLFIPNVNTVFGFVGSFCGGFIAFILPALYYMYSGNWTLRSVGWVNYFSTYLVLIAGCIAVVFGTGATVFFAISD